MVFLRVRLGSGVDGDFITASFYIKGVVSILKKNINHAYEIVDYLFLLKKKKLSIFVDDFEDGGFFLWDLIIGNNQYELELVVFDMEVYLLNVRRGGNILSFRSVKKLWPDTVCGRLVAFDEVFLKNLKNDVWVRRSILHQCGGVDLTDVRQVLALKKTIDTLSNIFKKYGFNIIKNNLLSLPSFSYKCFFKNFNKFNIKKHVSENIDCFVRGSYYGGRCEVFGNPVGGGEVVYRDFIGMYSQCMMELFPVDEGEFIFNNIDVGQPGFFDITFYSNMSIPVLPYKELVGGRLLFANGEMRGVYWYEEIALFLSKGGKILKTHAGYVFKKQDKVFSTFVEEFSKLKNVSPGHRVLAKLMINSLYGKFGVSRKSFKTATFYSQEEFENFSKQVGAARCCRAGNLWLVEYDDQFIKKAVVSKIKKDNNPNVVYASIITSKARIKLYKTFDKVLSLGHRLLYCDTDSVYVEVLGGGRLDIDSTRENKEVIIDAVFSSPKTYAIKYVGGERVVLKNSTFNNLTFNQFKDDFYTNKMSEPTTFGNSFRTIKWGGVFVYSYGKRRFDVGGKATTPLFYVGGEFF